MQYINIFSFSNKVLNRIENKLHRPRLFSKPIEIVIEPTLKCNSNCIMCNRNFNRKETWNANGFLSWDILLKAKPFFKYAGRILFGGFGEALLHPEYLAMLREIKKVNPFVYFFTNGILMTEEIGKGLVDAGMDMICISMGGATRDTYKKIRGVDAFEKVIENIKFITAYKKKTGKKTPMLSFNTVAMNSLLPELELLVKLANDIGVKHIAFPNLVVQGDTIRDESIWLNRENAKNAFTSASLLANKLQIKFIAPNLNIYQSDCKDIFKKMSINWDGKVMSCALERYIIGDLKENNIASIWNSKGMIKLREDYYEKGLEVICKNCACWDNRPDVFLNPGINSREYAEKV